MRIWSGLIGLFWVMLLTDLGFPEMGKPIRPGAPTQIAVSAQCDSKRMAPILLKSGDTLWFDKTPVTVAQFSAYAKERGLKTQAEIFGNSGVFDYLSGKWKLEPGAYWKWPFGKTGSPARYDHPVTHINFHEASAFCKALGKRLPTAAEWEEAARFHQPEDEGAYPWGSEIKDERGMYRANVWQGIFPFEQTFEDGYPYTSPVGVFGVHPSGLSDMAGNVWEWVQDSVPGMALPGEEMHHLAKGGSFLCEPSWCHGYLINGSTHTSAESGLFHIGFRCVCDPYVH